MDILNIFAISGLINGLISLGLGIFIIFHNWRDKINRLYFLIIIATSLWAFSYWRWLSSNDSTSALFWVRILSIGSTLIPVFYFHWVISLLKIEKLNKNLIRLVYVLGGFFVLFSFSGLFIEGVQQKLFFPFWPNPGFLYSIYLFSLYLCSVVYAVNLLLKSYKNSLGEERKRIEYILLGTLVAFGGGLTNFFLWYDVPIAPYGNFLVAFFPFLFGYASIRYRLFNIKVIATELFTIAIWVFLFIKILISQGYNDFLVNTILFIVVLLFGILLVRSITKEVEQKEKIEVIEKEVERAYAVEKRANMELQNLDKVKNQFIMQVQHDLRSPLGVFSGCCDLLLDGTLGKLPKKALEVIKRIQALARSKLGEVNTFLDVTQFQLGKGVLSLKPGVDVVSIAEEIVDELKLQAEAEEIYLRLEKPEETISIKADREKLKAAIFNIVDNCIKYTQKGGVAIKVKSQKSKVKSYDDGKNIDVIMIEVRDTGIGIDSDKLKTLFDTQFERSEEAQKMTSMGKGIGLYLSGQIIKAHNGKVWAESEGEGKGSTFYIELPIY